MNMENNVFYASRGNEIIYRTPLIVSNTKRKEGKLTIPPGADYAILEAIGVVVRVSYQRATPEGEAIQGLTFEDFKQHMGPDVIDDLVHLHPDRNDLDQDRSEELVEIG